MIDLQPNAEQEQVLDAIRSFLAGELSVNRLAPKPLAGQNNEASCWAKMAELGWFQLALPEELGGMGFSAAESVLVFREFGSYLLSPGVLATVAGAHLAAGAGRQDLVDALTSGQTRIGLGFSGRWSLVEAPDNVLVIDGGASPLLLYCSAEGVRLLEHTGADKAHTSSIDSTLQLHTIRLVDTCELAADLADGPIGRQVSLLIAAQLSGMADATRNMAVEYAKLREQFGNPIGAFQAIKHMCSDMAIRAEAARALVVYAAANADAGAADAGLDIAAAVLVAADAALKNAAINIQIHGGFGFTAECNAHHFLKRATVFERIAGLRGREAVLLSQPA